MGVHFSHICKCACCTSSEEYNRMAEISGCVAYDVTLPVFPGSSTDSQRNFWNYVCFSGYDTQRIPATYPHGHEYVEQWAALGAWFLGPKAENLDLFNDLALKAFKGNADFRKDYYPTDPDYITPSVTSTDAYRCETKYLKEKLDDMIQKLKNSVPNTSIRFEGHMCWDTTLPANLGYLAAILYNANNVANEASPVTTKFEIEAGTELCEMLGYKFVEGQPIPWGHITADGSIANIEAMWSCRNVKFYPLCVQRALNKNPQMAQAKGYEVEVPRLGKKEKLVDISTWDAMNLDIDDIVNMPQDVSNMAGIDGDVYTQIVDAYNLANLGWYEFMVTYGLTKQPVVFGPMSMHYSWPKAATMLGIGQQNLLGVEYDENARMDVADLKVKLLNCLAEQIPVISVVAVIGTTEESAVDPLVEILTLREELRGKGLNFAINADAAWGGYFMTMLHSPTEGQIAMRAKSSYIPSFPLSVYTTHQLLGLKDADTITVDPHKSGYCPYPAGGLCYRNGAMRRFVKVEADVVYHEGLDPSVGIWGVEGSKPGAAPAGVLLSHNVIGLDKLGYGRILGQCTFGGKLFYCLWLTLAKEDDNFVCVPMKPLPENMTLEEATNIIKKHIENKSTDTLQKDPDAMKFLISVGPDTVINAFAVNQKGNTDLDLCNRITFEVFRRLSHTNVTQNVQRIPMILTQSQLPPMKFGKAVKQFKRRLGLPEDTDGGLNFLINTVMNPWVADKDKIQTIGSAFRQTVLDAIGMMTDEPTYHGFVCAGLISESGEVFGDHIPTFSKPCHQYHAIAKFKILNSDDVKIIREKQQEQQSLPADKRQPIILSNKEKFVLQDFLETAMTKQQDVQFYVGYPKSLDDSFLTTKAKVLDIPLCRHLDLTIKQYPKNMTYFMYGEGETAYMSHDISKNPDFFQVVQLDQKPHSVPEELLHLGMDVKILQMEGSPLIIDGKITDPLQLQQYTIEYVSTGGVSIDTTINLSNPNAKVWFNTSVLNGDQ